MAVRFGGSGGGITALTIGVGATTIVGGAANRILFEDSTGTTLAQSANATYDGTSMTLAAGTITTDIAPLRLSETRNAVGTTFKGLTYTITDTASAAGSLAIQILGGAAGTTNLLSVAKAGQTTVGAGSGNTDLGLYFGTSGFGFFYYGSHVVSAGATGNGPAFGTNSLGFPQSTVLGWTGSSDPTAAKTLSLSQISAGVICVGTGAAGSFAGSLKLTNLQAVGYAELDEMTAPAGATNSARLFTQDNGAGKTQLMVIFGSGAAIQLAIEA